MKIWIWNAAAIATVLAVATLLPRGQERSRIAPYRFALPEKADAGPELAFFEDRVARSPEGLDLAALARAYLQQARRTGQSGWIDRAEAAARRSLEALPTSNPGALLALAHAAQLRHDFAGSIVLCDKVLRDRPSDPRALALKATAHLGLGRLHDAVLAADALVDRSPVSEHLALRAVILSARGEEPEARHDFERAYALEEPGDPEGSAWLRAMWARLALQRGRTGDAEDLLREALRIRPSLPLALGLLGDLELARKRLALADRAYADAFQASGDPVFLARRARARSGADAEDLRTAAEKALRESPGHRIQLAAVLLDRGTPESLREALSIAEAEARVRRNAETLEILARAYSAADRLRDARAAVREALRSGAPDPRLRELAADIESRLQRAAVRP